MEKYTQKIPGNIKIQELQKITLLGTYISYPKKGTIHQIDLYLVLNLGPKMGPVITPYYSMKFMC